jgi:hypothetical protein
MISAGYDLGFLQFRLSIRPLLLLFHFICVTLPHISLEIVENPIIYLDIIIVGYTFLYFLYFNLT